MKMDKGKLDSPTGDVRPAGIKNTAPSPTGPKKVSRKSHNLTNRIPKGNQISHREV